MDLVDLIVSRRFLGQEFLLWAWWRDDVADGLYQEKDDAIELHFDDRLRLEAHLAEAETSELRGGSPAHSPEAHKALQLGKRLAKARLRLCKGDREWVFTLDSSSFLFGGVKTPTVLSREDDEPFFERMFLIEELDEAITALFRQFLAVRLADGWEETRGQIAAWIAQPVVFDEPAETEDE